MTITIADVDRWDPGAVLEVFHAATSRGNAAQNASDGLNGLPAFTTWDGKAAEASQAAIGKVRADLDAHGQESFAVAKAAQNAADEIAAVKKTLADLRANAQAMKCVIDESGDVRPLVTTGPEADTYAIDAGLLRLAVKGMLERADAVDADLAAVIDMASGKKPIPPGLHDSRPEIRDALSKPLPTDPRQFHDLWVKLTAEEKDYLYSKDHTIGNRDGMPFVDRDHYNRAHLTELQSQAQKRLDDMAKEHPSWVGKESFVDTHPHNRGNHKERWDFEHWKDRYNAEKSKLDGLNQVLSTVNKNDGNHRYLGMVDDKGHAAVSIGNPDTARDNVTFVPGTGVDETRMDNYDNKMLRIQQSALSADRSLHPGDVAVTTWMGYDRPMSLADAAHRSYATDSAAALDSFQDGVRISHEGPRSFNSIIGHSYGSTMVGAAASGDHHLDVDRVVAIGSPGMLVHHAADLHIDAPDQVYASRADNDIIEYAEGTTLGPGPTGSADFGAHRFDSAPGPNTGWSWMGLPSVDAHSSYFDPGSAGLLNMGQLVTNHQPDHHK
ncbi:hypothetical protein HUN08_16540 [Gordonia sp. X0973]|uniref:alpha/beta hydrolase n=1 Tax=Gordonia sp. X0973 TaxID=2742602 RepID=UPI000F52E913|nr:alpha/beta hydrolase [Gordonia sp. X0973]QKT08631.1 hypothetical protein HUN08_16540 [Gordonia sp. X0973]